MHEIVAEDDKRAASIVPSHREGAQLGAADDGMQRVSEASRGESKLCGICIELVQSFPEPGTFSSFREFVRLPQSVAELEESATWGCPFCSFRWQAIPQRARTKLRQCTQVDYMPPRKAYVGRFIIDFRYSYTIQTDRPKKISEAFHNSEDTLRTELRFKKVKDDSVGDYLGLGLAEDDNSSSTASSNSFNCINTWIQTCNTTHEDCQATTRALESVPDRFRPTRLLDLGTHSTAQPRLIEVLQLETKPEYITLSHCWGDYMPPRLTTGNLDQFRQGIDPVNLPPTFKDAIDITRRLSVRYLWIDSLCIIQDSEKDWRLESATMDQTYEHAWCNIAAAGAADARGGCYSDRNLRHVLPLLVALPHSSPEAKYLGHISRWDSWVDNIEESPLLKRAWVVQEQLLSTRTIYFTQHQIFWRCKELRASEHEPEELQSYWLDYHDDSSDESPEDPTLVKKYTQCQLSMPEKDKLVAISGLAKRYGHGSNYLAGLWRHLLPEQLLWQTDLCHEAPCASRNRRSPSWSWASVD
ncbi:HET-domain-containing protein [Lophium mytilinum]|uniref:HET-domain-containing protein n=1 Tax=Lophium mytilinum TaxID=390894 RepID=A0A6A6QMN8_9PEZI|nr:HET-domain-containing protein [Lophium mytilinum]